MHMKIHFMLFFNLVFIFTVHYATMYKDINGGMTHETHKKKEKKYTKDSLFFLII